MARVADEGRSLFVEDDDDDIIEVQVNARGRPHNTLESLLLPRPGRPSARSSRAPSFAPHSHTHDTRRHDRRPQPSRADHSRHHIHQHAQPAAVIDLTEEPDSPEEPRASQPQAQSQSQSQGGRNPRRTASQRLTPPRLSRSDSTFMAPPPPASFIDLTESPDDDLAPEPLRPRSQRNAHRHAEGPRVPHPLDDRLIQLELMQDQPRIMGGLGGFAGGFAGRLAGILGADIIRAGFRAPNLDVSRNPFAQREPSPKPPMDPPPPTRVGFTRDTRAESDDGAERVVICPACDEELAYDPTNSTMQASAGSGGRKRKRAPGEHHFWALKKCGHVYCADCFENRRPTKMAPDGVGFPCPGGTPNDIRCAVDGCEVKVVNKGEWVGIYL